MSAQSSYGQFCPVAMASEIFCQRWTPLILREMFCGSHRFNDLRRGVPRMSPSLLSKRLADMQEAGIIAATAGSHGGMDYHLTAAGEDLKELVMGLGNWGQRWVESKLSLKNLDPDLLMWDMRRCLDPKPLPQRRCVIAFHFTDVTEKRQNYWLVVEANGKVDVCSADPGFDVDLYVNSTLHAMTAIWMGTTSVRVETAGRRLALQGNAQMASAMQDWLGLSPFAKEKKRVPE